MGSLQATYTLARPENLLTAITHLLVEPAPNRVVVAARRRRKCIEVLARRVLQPLQTLENAKWLPKPDDILVDEETAARRDPCAPDLALTHDLVD